MKPKDKIYLKWQNNIYEVGIEKPLLPGNNETRANFSSVIDDEPKPICFYLCESLMEPTDPDVIHPYLQKLFQRKFSVGELKTDKNQVSFFKIYESDDYGASSIWINNNEARIQFARSL